MQLPYELCGERMRMTKAQKRRRAAKERAAEARRVAVKSLGLADRRKAAAITQEDMAARLNTTQSTISRIESGGLAIRVEQVRDIADAYGVPMESLLPRAA